MPRKRNDDYPKAVKSVVVEDDEPREPRRRPRLSLFRLGIMNRLALIGTLIIGVLALVGACVLVTTLFNAADIIGGPVENFLQVFGFEPGAGVEEVDSQLIVLGIQKMSLLQTASAEVEIIESAVDTSTSPDSRLVMTSKGSAVAGVDLSLVTEQNVVVNGDGSLTIALPPLQVIDCILRDKVIETECTDLPWPISQDCDRIIERMRSNAERWSLDQLREKAVNHELVTLDGRELLSEAYDNAEAVIYDFLASLGHTQVQFVASEEPLIISPTCYPAE